jgi:DNA polymerase-3 subunit gamma/tau
MQTLNLARKWRSKTFDTVIGQDLTIKMLKNSLYTNHYFPVYLLAGQRGCGKTSTARIFAAAVNCHALESFQKDPKGVVLPCQSCVSCTALASGMHPDVIEIDAASHTGVDNVRMIVESSSLLPLMGRKKIYLIDEAHMLSKAAFNAFLKILEEPPVSVLFLLATTDPQKIIDTVRSRCFQLFFSPIETGLLTDHLALICEKEEIAVQRSALSLIAKETGGSVRDAINLLEQVRFIAQPITADAVHKVLGHVDDERMLQLFELILHKTPAHVLSAAHEMKLETYSAEFLWQRLVSLIRASLWIKYQVTTPFFAEHRTQLEFLLRTVPVMRLMSMLEDLYASELLFGKTTAAYPFLEMMLLKLCQTQNNNSNSTIPLSVAPSASVAEQPLVPEQEADEQGEGQEEETPEEENNVPDTQSRQWQQFIKAIETVQDPLLLSLFSQGIVLSIDDSASTICVQFPKELNFFQSLLQESQGLCKQFFKQTFGKELSLQPDFSGASTVSKPLLKTQMIATPPPVYAAPVAKPKAPFGRAMPDQARFSVKNKFQPLPPREPVLNVSNAQQWPMANLVLKYFPGTVTEIQERA